MVTDLVQIRRLGDKKRDENERFRRHLKRHDFVERRFRRIAGEIEEQIDCTVCANCCKVATVRITERDVEKLSRYLRLKPAQFLRDYTQENEEEGLILRRSESGCIFLDGASCTVYEARPHNCEYFPHVVRGEGSLVSRMWQMIDRASYCPIVYNTLESWKREAGFVGLK
ncbi:MAG: YkgJ family cysteine cluster protein [Bryobacteraceae bacterium]